MIHRIGVFDSGMGGLTVLHRLRSAFPGLDMIYLGDVARVPYGGRSVETINRYAVEDVEFLLRREVDAVAVACGTVSSNSLELLRERYTLPIFGVIDSAAKKAARVSRSRSVGIIGTQATVKSGAFERAVLRHAPDARVTAAACPLIVPLVENGVAADDPVTEIICGRYLSAFDGTGVDALILGCTHYPVYRAAFEKRLPGVTMIDVGEALAEELRALYPETGGEGRTEYCVTERSAAFDQLVRVMDVTVDPGCVQVVRL